MDEHLVINLKTARNCQCSDALFNSPTIGKEDETIGELWALNDFYDTMCPDLNSVDEPILVATIDDYGFDPGAEPDQPFDQRDTAILVLHVRAGDFDGQ
ncbi:hypothetical protein CCP1ISM_170005 [Azospirillaceae bacterium]